MRLFSPLLVSTLLILNSACTHKKEPKTTPHCSPSSVCLSIPSDPGTCDPRKARDLLSIDIVRFLFSGLTRLTSDGHIVNDLAQSIELLPDGSTYHIKLKKAAWSDGSPITASDFEYSWKSVLQKQRACPSAFQLFWVSRAKDVYEERVSPDQLGVRVFDDETLEVSIERPCPFFLQLLAIPTFFAVQKQYDINVGVYDGHHVFPTSGPYTLSSWASQNNLSITKNPHFLDAGQVRYDQVVFPIVDDTTAVCMFEKQELDWAGSPMGTIPPDMISSLKRQEKIFFSPATGTCFLRVNLSKPFLSDIRIREACSSALQKEAITEHIVQCGNVPAQTLVPPCLLRNPAAPKSPDLDRSRSLVASYCQDKGISPDSITLTLTFAACDRSSKIAQAIQQDLRTIGITVVVVPCEARHYYTKVSQLDYDLALGSWYADYFDPYSFYGVFERATNGTNNTGWESLQYQKILAESQRTSDSLARQEKFLELEAILAKELPIIPLYHGSFAYIKRPTVEGLSISPLGHIDVER